MALLEGKRALITGLASNRSIAWGIAKAMQREGAEIALTYQNEKLKPRVEKFAAELGSNLAFPCDVGDDRAIAELFRTLATHWDVLDIVVHSASGIRGFRKMMSFYEKTAPLGRGVTIDEVGNAAAFLCSDLASGITGEISYVDAGFNSVGISPHFAEEEKSA